MTDNQPGILAIWNDCIAHHEAEFEAWFQGAAGGAGLPVRPPARGDLGFERYFNFYLTQSPAVLTSPAYLERLDNPTPITRMICRKSSST